MAANFKQIKVSIEENPKVISAEIDALISEAKKCTAQAYAPYSQFHVGAAVLLENGQIITGTNQENAAYPSGLCAERVAIFHANHQYPDIAVKAIAIAAYHKSSFVLKPISPCGSCRQVLLETETRYGRKIEVYLTGEANSYYISSVRELLPLAFDSLE